MNGCSTKIMLVFSLLIGNIVLAAAESYPEINSQQDFQKFMLSTARDIYEKINHNVTFSVDYGTRSPFWETQEVLVKHIMFKARGVSLRDALASLLEADSGTEFECSTAQAVFFWHVMLHPVFRMEEVIAKLEAEDEGFRLPLVMDNMVTALTYQVQYYGFAHRKGKFTFSRFDGSKTDVLIEEEYAKFVRLKKSFDTIQPLFAVTVLTGKLTKDSPAGAFSYLANVPGVSGPARGENLISLGSGLYYGFGPTFERGPQNLQTIGEQLRKSIKHAEYKNHVKTKVVKKAKNLNVHPLQLMDASIAGSIFNFAAIKAVSNKMLGEYCMICGKQNELSRCGRCKKVFYCSRECQKADWQNHKPNCQN